MKFSVIIPVYNVVSYLRETLDSLLAQTFEDWEAICVDDGSTDGSGAILDEYAVRDGRFKIIHKTNGGEGSARNAGLDVAVGNWLCYLDADDLYAPIMLETFVEMIGRHPNADIVSVNRLNFFGDKPIRSQAFDTHDSQTADCVIDAAEDFGSRFLGRGFWCGAYRRSLHGDERFSAYRIGADRVYLVKCVAKSNEIALSDARMYLYRQRLGSAMNSSYDAGKITDLIAYIEECLEVIVRSAKTPPKAFKRELTNQLLEFAQHQTRKLSGEERRVMQSNWRSAVLRLSGKGILTSWGSFVATLLRILPCKVVAACFCELPYRLKTMGIHR